MLLSGVQLNLTQFCTGCPAALQLLLSLPVLHQSYMLQNYVTWQIRTSQERNKLREQRGTGKSSRKQKERHITGCSIDNKHKIQVQHWK